MKTLLAISIFFVSLSVSARVSIDAKNKINLSAKTRSELRSVLNTHSYSVSVDCYERPEIDGLAGEIRCKVSTEMTDKSVSTSAAGSAELIKELLRVIPEGSTSRFGSNSAETVLKADLTLTPQGLFVSFGDIVPNS